jgi:hypothetical protein
MYGAASSALQPPQKTQSLGLKNFFPSVCEAFQSLMVPRLTLGGFCSPDSASELSLGCGEGRSPF